MIDDYTPDQILEAFRKEANMFALSLQRKTLTNENFESTPIHVADLKTDDDVSAALKRVRGEFEAHLNTNQHLIPLESRLFPIFDKNAGDTGEITFTLRCGVRNIEVEKAA